MALVVLRVAIMAREAGLADGGEIEENPPSREVPNQGCNFKQWRKRNGQFCWHRVIRGAVPRQAKRGRFVGSIEARRSWKTAYDFDSPSNFCAKSPVGPASPRTEIP